MVSDGSKIEWTDATWNPVTGCSVISPGCTNCYAMRLAGGRMRNHPSRLGLTNPSKAGPVWNGDVLFNEQWLRQPFSWGRPRMVFVCAHGDLFHENVPDEWIDRVFAVMALASQHTFQVLTKRSGRMREYIDSVMVDWEFRMPEAMVSAGLGSRPGLAANVSVKWPLPNVWLGVSAEDQTRTDERIPDLLQTPAAIRFVSLEPLLGPIDLTQIDDGSAHREVPREEWGPLDDDESPPALWWDVLSGQRTIMHGGISGDWERYDAKLDWVIVGGESGPNARPMHPDWARSLRDQCASARVPFFFKQWGEYAPYDRGRFTTGHTDIPIQRFGKRAAGRLLDGREWNEMPGARA